MNDVANTVGGGFGMNATDLAPLTSALQEAITPQEMIATLAVLVGIGIGFVLMWFGVRKAISIFRKAVMRGKISA